MSKKNDIVKTLLDENNHEPIIIYDEDNREIRFEQVAALPMFGTLYAILKPIDNLDGIDEDQALVFLVDYDEDGNSFLMIEHSEEIAMKVFEEYQRLLDNYND